MAKKKDGVLKCNACEECIDVDRRGKYMCLHDDAPDTSRWAHLADIEYEVGQSGAPDWCPLRTDTGTA